MSRVRGTGAQVPVLRSAVERGSVAVPTDTFRSTCTL